MSHVWQMTPWCVLIIYHINSNSGTQKSHCLTTDCTSKWKDTHSHYQFPPCKFSTRTAHTLRVKAVSKRQIKDTIRVVCVPCAWKDISAAEYRVLAKIVSTFALYNNCIWHLFRERSDREASLYNTQLARQEVKNSVDVSGHQIKMFVDRFRFRCGLIHTEITRHNALMGPTFSSSSLYSGWSYSHCGDIHLYIKLPDTSLKLEKYYKSNTTQNSE